MMRIICPSKGRARTMSTNMLVNDMTILVPYGEREEYEKYNPDDEIMETPEGIKGITATKQWMLDNLDDWFSIDDDVHTVKRLYEDNDSESYVEDPEEISDIIHRCYYMAKEAGAFMFGFSKERNPLMFVSQKPFQFSGYMNSSHFGIIKGSKLYYNLDMSEGEDHWLSCLNAYLHRYYFMDTRFAFYTKDNFMALGGCNDYRTQESMKNNTLLLRRVFGDVIRIKTPMQHRKNVNYGERSISIPL